MNKHELRLAYKAGRQALSERECAVWASELSEKVISLRAFHEAQTILGYLAMPREANLDIVLQEALALGKKVYVPVCINDTLMVAARLFSLDDVSKGVLGIRIPREPHELIDPSDLDLVLMPGVAFDREGRRIGMGAGYYDRFLEQISLEKRIGIAWNMQIHDGSLPVEQHDEKVACIVTNKEIIDCSPKMKGEQN